MERKNAVRTLETARMLANLDRHHVELVHGDRASGRCRDGGGRRRGRRPARRLAADAVLIATGSSPFRPPGIPFEDPDVHDSDTILEIDRLPASLAVLGGGVIGCEYASMFAALGVDVHLVERAAPLLPFLDAEIGERLLGGDGRARRDLRTSASAPRASARSRRRGSVVLELRRAPSSWPTRCSSRPAAPATPQGLGLDGGRASQTDARGCVARRRRISGPAVPGIYAAGDVIGFPALASTSMEQARVAVCHAFGFDYKQELSQPAALRRLHDPRGELRRA